MKEPETPTLERMRQVRGVSQKIGGFLAWLQEQGIVLAKYHKHTDACYDRYRCVCGALEDELYNHYEAVERLLARFFEIDLDKVEEERRALLDYLAKKHKAG